MRALRPWRIWPAVALLVVLLPVAVYAAFVGSAAKAEIALGIWAGAAWVVTTAICAGAAAFFFLPELTRWLDRRRRSRA